MHCIHVRHNQSHDLLVSAMEKNPYIDYRTHSKGRKYQVICLQGYDDKALRVTSLHCWQNVLTMLCCHDGSAAANAPNPTPSAIT